MSFPLIGTGVWSPELRYGDSSAAAEAAVELEELGYSAIWLPDVGGDLFSAVNSLLTATASIVVATGILNLWMHEPADAADWYQSAVANSGDRLLVGIGVSHAPLINSQEADRYQKPLTKMHEYLDGIDATSAPIPTERRVLAALGPKMLELARTRTAGAHPYLVTPQHTAETREALGREALIGAEQAVVLETDPTKARAIARTHLATYLQLPNYANNWKRQGYSDADIADGGSNALVDALVVWGDEAAIQQRVKEQRDAGADHVCVQVLTGTFGPPPVELWRRLAPALLAS